jgi:uncharacterized protein (TIGR00255 family)
MALSMTGYGRGEAKSPAASAVVELKSVNHRHFEAMLNLPASLWALESKLREQLRVQIQRGHVDVWLQVSAPALEHKVPVVDAGLARHYVQAVRRLGKILNLPDQADLRWVASLPEVVRLETRPAPLARLEPLVRKALSQALQRLQAMRRTEGLRLAKDIRQRLNALMRLRREIAARVAGNALSHKKEAGAENKNGNGFSARTDVTEELVRLQSHAAQFAEFLRSRRPVGRALDFLIQEMNREVNTIGSKSLDAFIAHRVVAAKEEMEKIREQVQNLE